MILAQEFSELFDGFSIGSNDLTQLTLGIDRDSELLAHLFELGFDAAVGFTARFLQGGDLQLRLVERILDRLDHVLDGLLTIAEFALGAFVLSAQVLLGQPQEVLAVCLERLVGKV